MKVNCLFLVFFLVFNYSGIAQEKTDSENDEALRESVIKPAEYIFEGSVLQTKNYTTKNGKLVTQAIVEIHKVFRGELKPGLLEIITCGQGWFFDENEKKWYMFSMEHSFSNCGFEIGHSDLFFGVKSTEVLPKTDCPVTNKFVIQQIDRAHYTLGKREFLYNNEAYLGGGQILQTKTFKKLQDLYNFILETPNTKLIDFDHKTFVKLGRDGFPLKN